MTWLLRNFEAPAGGQRGRPPANWRQTEQLQSADHSGCTSKRHCCCVGSVAAAAAALSALYSRVVDGCLTIVWCSRQNYVMPHFISTHVAFLCWSLISLISFAARRLQLAVDYVARVIQFRQGDKRYGLGAECRKRSSVAFESAAPVLFDRDYWRRR